MSPFRDESAYRWMAYGEDFTKVLAEQRRRYELNQAEIATKIGYDRTWVTCLENGKKTINDYLTFRHVAEAYQMTLTDIRYWATILLGIPSDSMQSVDELLTLITIHLGIARDPESIAYFDSCYNKRQYATITPFWQKLELFLIDALARAHHDRYTQLALIDISMILMHYFDAYGLYRYRRDLLMAVLHSPTIHAHPWSYMWLLVDGIPWTWLEYYGQPEQAMIYARQGFGYAQACQSFDGMALAATFLALAYLQQGLIDKAQSEIQTAWRLYHRVGIAVQLRIKQSAAEIAFAAGNYREAFSLWDEADTLEWQLEPEPLFPSYTYLEACLQTKQYDRLQHEIHQYQTAWGNPIRLLDQAALAWINAQIRNEQRHYHEAYALARYSYELLVEADLSPIFMPKLRRFVQRYQHGS